MTRKDNLFNSFHLILECKPSCYSILTTNNENLHQIHWQNQQPDGKYFRLVAHCDDFIDLL